MRLPSITHHGAVQGVTGSCHQLQLAPGESVLVDCGLFQGGEVSGGPEQRLCDVTLVALVITHVHIDHVKRIPELLAAGFTGPIICSEPSAMLLPLVLEDAFRLAHSRDMRQIERYLRQVASQTIALPFEQWHTLPGNSGARVRLQRAGHILGSAYVECDVPREGGQPCRVVFSGDLGAGDSPLLIGPQPPERADVLVLESTYGDREHAGREYRQQQLEGIIDLALADHGTLLIPAFTLGRTQDLLHELGQILQRKALVGQGGSAAAPVDWPQLPVILDSPLATKITQAYQALSHFWNAEAQRGQRLAFPQLITVNSHEEHQKVVNYLASTLRPAIVIAGNGMCSSGRIVNYLKHMLRHPRHNLLFTGYQAKGTPGAVLRASEGAEGFVTVALDGERYEVNARVHSVAGYSAHAGQSGLVAFAKGMQSPPRQIRLVHGEANAKVALSEKLRECLGSEILIP